MGELLKICGVSIICSVALVIVEKNSGGVRLAVKLGSAVMVVGLAVSLLLRAVEYLQGFALSQVPMQYFSVMLKALGICVLCRICADICRDCGDTTAAGAVESAAKFSLVLLSLPILEELMAYARALVGGIEA